ncbi:MAG: phosphoribosylamine--glycine ligase [Patescibacteria group bacterium]
MNILLIGSGAREHAIARAIKNSKHHPDLFCFGSSRNPGIFELSAKYEVGNINDPSAVLNFAKKNNIDWAIVGPENPLEAGVSNTLWDNDIPCVGPKKTHAQLETSKRFTRELLTEYNIPGCPKYKFFNSMEGVKEFLNELGDLYVVKADGLMSGKGVKVAGDHLHSHEGALQYCEELVAKNSAFVIEEKLIGQEFSYMSICDGDHLAHTFAIQDHKRAFVNDVGANTGGMGTYSDANHSLPFLTADDIKQAQKINLATARALKNKFGEGYKGVLYGGFMTTADGVKLIEYNARFGDPEAMNVFALLESDFVDACQAVVNGALNQTHLRFANKASVCKYAVPNGYPDNPIKNQKIDISETQNNDSLYYAAVDERKDGLYETGSRAIAVVGVANTIAEAEQIAEAEVCRIKGPLFHREDIGTIKLIGKRVEMMEKIRKN